MLRNGWLKAAALLVIFGWGPLLGIIALSALGVWPDPNPNPIGPGLLFFVTFVPAIVCWLIGARKAGRE